MVQENELSDQKFASMKVFLSPKGIVIFDEHSISEMKSLSQVL